MLYVGSGQSSKRVKIDLLTPTAYRLKGRHVCRCIVDGILAIAFPNTGLLSQRW